jgi:hypothetical protein
LSEGTREAVFEDGLLDLLIAQLELQGNKPASLIDAENLTVAFLGKALVTDTRLVASGLKSRMSMKIWMFCSGITLPEDSAISKLLKAVKIAKDRKAPTFLLTHPNGVSHLTVRVPCLGDKDEAGMKTLTHILRFNMTMLGVKFENLKIIKDQSLGSTCSLPAAIGKAMDSLMASAGTSRGLSADPPFKFKNGFEANLVESLAALRLLNTKRLFIRTKPAKKVAKGPRPPAPIPVTESDLRELILQKLGLKSPTLVVTLSINMLRWTINAMCSTHNRTFPGGYICAAKDRNGVKTNEGLLLRMGYVPKTPSGSSIISVFSTGTQEITKDGVKSIKLCDLDKKSNPNGIDFRSYRTAMVLCCPKLSDSSDDEMIKQLNVNDVDVKSAHTLRAFNEPEMRILCDELARAYGAKISLKVKDTKTKPVHYRAEKNAVVNASANLNFYDSVGNTYKNLDDVPLSIRRFVAKTFNYKLKEKREAPGDPEGPQPPKKQRTVNPSSPRLANSDEEHARELKEVESLIDDSNLKERRALRDLLVEKGTPLPVWLDWQWDLAAACFAGLTVQDRETFLCDPVAAMTPPPASSEEDGGAMTL